jgi:TolA-binding protein
MVGASYLHISEFEKAIKYLSDFDGNGASQVQSKAYLLLGHAYAEQKKTTEALSNYKKAASVNEKDEFFAADALLTAAAYADATGNSKEAISLYEEVKDKYPTNTAVQNGEVDKNLAKLGVIK